MPQGPILTISHFGVCTSDVKSSVRFYTEALGFTLDHSIEDVGAPFDVLSEIPGLKLEAHFLKRDGVMIELLGFRSPGVTGPAERRPMNQLGLTHMSFAVDDIDAVADRIVKYGGRAHPETKIEYPGGAMIFCTDPDGIRIELMQSED